MTFDPALLDELARVFAEAAVREIQKETPTDEVGVSENVPSVKERQEHEQTTTSRRRKR